MSFAIHRAVFATFHLFDDVWGNFSLLLSLSVFLLFVPFIHLFIHSFAYSFVRSFIHTFFLFCFSFVLFFFFLLCFFFFLISPLLFIFSLDGLVHLLLTFIRLDTHTHTRQSQTPQLPWRTHAHTHVRVPFNSPHYNCRPLHFSFFFTIFSCLLSLSFSLSLSLSLLSFFSLFLVRN